MKADWILNNIIMVFEYFTFFYVVFHRTFRDKNSVRLICTSILGLIWLGTVVAGFDWNSSLIGPVPWLLIPLVLFQWLVFEISAIESFVFGVSTWLGLSLIEENLLIALKRPGIEDAGVECGIMISVTACIWVVYLLTRKQSKNALFFFPIKVWILLDIIMLILMTMISYFAYVIVEILPENNMILFGRNLLLLGGIAITFSFFVFLYYCSSAYYYSMEKNLVETQMVQQRYYYNQLLLKEEETKRFRHDVINDFLEIKSFCDNKEYEKMGDYLEKVTGAVIKLNKKHYDVGNDIINTILNYYLLPINEENEVTVSGYLSDCLSIDDREICIVCSNLIRNAMEAVKKNPGGIIRIHFSEGKDYVLMEVVNSCHEEIQFDKGGCLKTSKKDARNHGIGIRNVKDIVKKNKGSFKIELKDGLFKTELYLKKCTVQE